MSSRTSGVIVESLDKDYCRTTIPAWLRGRLYDEAEAMGREGEVSDLVADSLSFYLNVGIIARLHAKADLLLAEHRAPSPGSSGRDWVADYVDDEAQAEALDALLARSNSYPDTDAELIQRDPNNSESTDETAQLNVRLPVELLAELRQHAIDHYGGPRSQGTIIARALAHRYLVGTPVDLLDAKLDLLLAENDIKSPVLASWSESMLDYADAEMGKDAVPPHVPETAKNEWRAGCESVARHLTVDPDAIDINELEMDDDVAIDPDTIDVDAVKTWTRYRAPVVMAVLRHQFKNRPPIVREGQIEKLAREMFDPSEPTVDAIVDEVAGYLDEAQEWRPSRLAEYDDAQSVFAIDGAQRRWFHVDKEDTGEADSLDLDLLLDELEESKYEVTGSHRAKREKRKEISRQMVTVRNAIEWLDSLE
ncbi:hypothetical protein EXE43_15740 [Halorubrum sp. SS5]|nr:hypothetical protein EXE43_15740 [Halorubrum sp. SS5]